MVRRPILDDHEKADILERTHELAPRYVDAWDVESEDAGTALLEAFAELGEGITERLNQTPAKHRVTFLDMLDFTPNPPQPATLPVTFSVRPGAPENVVIPNGTAVEAVATDSRPAQRFETVGETDFEATPARIQNVYAVDGGIDRIVDHGSLQADEQSVTLFDGEDCQFHALYIGDSEQFAVGPGATVDVELTTNAPPPLLSEYLIWEYYGTDADGEEGWQPLAVDGHDDADEPTASELTISELDEVRRIVEKLRLILPHEGFVPATEATELVAKALADDVRKGRFAGPGTHQQGPSELSTLVDGTALDDRTQRTIGRQLESLKRRLREAARGTAFGSTPKPVEITATVPGEPVEHELDGVTSLWVRVRPPESDLSQALFNTLVESVRLRTDWEPPETDDDEEPPDEDDDPDLDEDDDPDFDEDDLATDAELGIEDVPLDEDEFAVDIDLAGVPVDDDFDLEGVPGEISPGRVEEFPDRTPGELESRELPPDVVVANDTQMDPRSGMNMLFFGEVPMTGQTTEIACEIAFAVPGTEVAMQLTRPDGLRTPPLSEPPEVVWEYAAGSGWKPLAVDDTTHALQTSGTVRFEVPDDIATETIQGWQGHWIRVRLLAGDYGQPQIVEVSTNNWQQVTDHIATPIYSEISINYDPPETAADEKPAADAATPPALPAVEPESEPEPEPESEPELEPEPDGEIEVDPEPAEPVAVDPEPAEFTAAEQLVVENNRSMRQIEETAEFFHPFESTPGTTQALYLGFDAQLVGGPLQLYVPISEATYPDGFTPLIDVEYCADPEAGVWQRTGIEDGTDDLTERGILKLTMPEPSIPVELFGVERHWLRITVTGDEFDRTDRTLFVPEDEIEGSVHVREVLSYQSLARREARSYTRRPPTVDGLYPNTQWAENVESVTGAVVGSSNGTASQKFELPDKPALDVSVWVDELDALSERAANALIDDRSIAVEAAYDGDGHRSKLWVRWEAAADFIGSGPTDRQFVIDETAGTISFGDGREGAIPPEGETNIRVDYKRGGGDDGNKRAGTVETLLDPIENIERVTNHEPGKIGEPAEPLAEFVKRAPKNLRDRNKPVTRDGFVRITKSISREIARVRCIAGEDETGTPGKVVLILVPDVAEQKPLPSEALLNRVESEMQTRVPAAVFDGEHSQLTVRGPDYVEVSVTATVASTGTQSVTTVTDMAISELTAFSHPLSGGPEDDGWAIGALPEPSLFAARLEKLDPVAYVTDLAVTYREGDRQLTLAMGETPPEIAPDILVYSGRHTVSLDVEGSR